MQSLEDHGYSGGTRKTGNTYNQPKRPSTLMSVTRRKLQTPGNAEEHKKQETPTVNPIGPTDKPHRPRTKHYRKDSPRDA